MTRPSNDLEKWRFLRDAPWGDMQSPELQALAKKLWEAADANRERFVLLCHTVARDWIRYQTDTKRVGGEDIAGFTRQPTPNDAIDALERGVEDCDGKARLFVALCLCRGVAARMRDLWRDGALAHVFAEVRVHGKWLPVELTLARARLGETGFEVPKEQNGKWKLT